MSVIRNKTRGSTSYIQALGCNVGSEYPRSETREILVVRDNQCKKKVRNERRSKRGKKSQTLDGNARLFVFANGITFVARQDSATAALARRDANVGDRRAILSSAHRSATSARFQVGKRIEAFRLGAEDPADRASGHARGAEESLELGVLGSRLLLVLRDSIVALGISSSALARLGARWSRRGRLAALGVRVPLPVGRARRNRRWWRVLRYTAALLSMPVPTGWAVVSARRERRRWVSVRKTARATTPPPFVVATIIVLWWGCSRRATRVCAGIPDPSVAARWLVVRGSVPRGTAVGVLVPEPQVGASIPRGRAGRRYGSANLNAAVLVLPVPASEIAAKIEGGHGGSSSTDQDGHSRGYGRKTHS